MCNTALPGSTKGTAKPNARNPAKESTGTRAGLIESHLGNLRCRPGITPLERLRQEAARYAAPWGRARSAEDAAGSARPSRSIPGPAASVPQTLLPPQR